MEYDRIDVPEIIDTNKTDSSRECIICHYGYFLWINLKFQPKVFGGCHNVTQTSINFDETVIITVIGHDYRIKC